MKRIRQASRLDAGRDDKGIVFDRAAVIQDDPPSGGVDFRDATAKFQPDALTLIVGQALDRTMIASFSLQHLLGELRPLVGRMRLVADEGQSPGEACLAQTKGHGRTGLTGAGYDDVMDACRHFETDTLP